MISWNRGQQQVQVLVASSTGSRIFPLDRPSGTMAIALPLPPYRIAYKVNGQTEITLASSSPPLTKPVLKKPDTTQLLGPILPKHLSAKIRRAPQNVEMFIKVNPSGKIAGTSSPYYPDEIRRELARIASDTALKAWRFQPTADNSYRDGRVLLSFQREGTKIRARF